MLENQKKIWITGASSGIGRALAIKFAKENWKVAISARRKELLDQLAQDENISSFALDVTDDSRVEEVFSEIQEKFGYLDLCIFCSGAYNPKLEQEINKKQAIDLVTKDGMNLADLSDEFKNDREVVLTAVKKDFAAFKHADDSFKKNINISNINFKKIKEDMDQDGDFLHWDTDEKVSITRSGFENQTEYRVFVESDQDDDTGEYDVYGEFGSSIDEIEEAIECFLDNGGDIMSFLIDEYLNIEKSIKERV